MSNQISKQDRESLNSEFLDWFRVVEDYSHKLIEENLRPFDLSLSQGYLFGVIVDWVQKGTPPRQKDLEKEMRLVKSSITNLVQGLERKGMILRTESAVDGRAKELHVTDKGWKIREKLGRDRAKWQAALTKPLTDKELVSAVQLLRKLGQSHD